MPFVNPVTVQVVAKVVHTVAPLVNVTTYDRGVVFETAVQLSVTLLLATDAESPVGAEGFVGDGATSIGPLGAPLTVTAELAPAEFVATTEKTYVVPFVSPVTVHVFVAVVHV